jgi:hypothetical protein
LQGNFLACLTARKLQLPQAGLSIGIGQYFASNRKGQINPVSLWKMLWKHKFRCNLPLLVFVEAGQKSLYRRGISTKTIELGSVKEM